MLTLILETSSEDSCIVLADGKTVISHKKLAGGPELSKRLAMEVKILVGSERPKRVAVGGGPGSYTGIRVGAALGKALAWGWGAELVGFCSLAAFGDWVAVDAGRGWRYVWDGKEAKRVEGGEVVKGEVDPARMAKLAEAGGQLVMNYLSSP